MSHCYFYFSVQSLSGKITISFRYICVFNDLGDDKHQHDDSSSLNDEDMELSTLPSPNSVSDFESIAGSINTDMLVKGFYKNTKQGMMFWSFRRVEVFIA